MAPEPIGLWQYISQSINNTAVRPVWHTKFWALVFSVLGSLDCIRYVTCNESIIKRIELL
jgi:hypothetical protein